MAGEDTELFKLLYQAVVDDELWPEVLDRFTHLIDARGFIIFEVFNNGNDRSIELTQHNSALDGVVLRKYVKEHNPVILSDQDMYSSIRINEDRVDLATDIDIARQLPGFYDRPNIKMVRDRGIHHWAVGYLDKDNTSRHRFSVQFTEKQGPLNDERRTTMGLHLQHLAKAIDNSDHAAALRAQQLGLMAAIDRLQIGVCVLDSRGCVVVSNSEFDRQIDEYGAFQVDYRKRLQILDPEGAELLSDLTSGIEQHGKAGARPRKEAIILGKRRHQPALCIDVVPLEREHYQDQKILGGAVLFSRDTGHSLEVDTDVVKKVFGFTKAEMRVLEHVLEGEPNKKIAEAINRSPDTVNSHIRTIFTKTDVENRTMLARLFANFSRGLLKR